MENKEGKFISLSGTELYYEIVGGGTPVLMLHGWGVDRRIMSGCMEFVFQKNKQKFMRIYFDLPGMGKSKAGESIKNSDGMLEVIIAFIEKVIPNQKFILVGESYGGYLARALVQKMSQRILGLFLICPLVYPGYRAGEVPAKTVLEKDVSLLESLTRQERESFEYITIVQNRRVWNGFKESAYEAIKSKDCNGQKLNPCLKLEKLSFFREQICQQPDLNKINGIHFMLLQIIR